MGDLDAHHRHQVGMVENKQQEWVSLGHRECERSAGCPRKHWVLGLEFWRAHSASDRALRNSNILMDLSLNMLV